MYRIETCGSTLICVDTCMSVKVGEKAFPNYNKSKLTNRKEMELEPPLVAVRTYMSHVGSSVEAEGSI